MGLLSMSARRDGSYLDWTMQFQPARSLNLLRDLPGWRKKFRPVQDGGVDLAADAGPVSAMRLRKVKMRFVASTGLACQPTIVLP